MVLAWQGSRDCAGRFARESSSFAREDSFKFDLPASLGMTIVTNSNRDVISAIV
jgi:hypothetical protein